MDGRSVYDAQFYICGEQYRHRGWKRRHSKSQIQMKKYQEKAIPLIFRTESKGTKSGWQYEANPEALAFLKSIQGKIAVISVAGMYRTGKSYLLNTIMLKQKGGFAVGPTTNPKTKGIWVWGKPLIFKNEKDQMINVVVMDSEGLGSTEEDQNHDLRLFSITLLLSSIFLYNTMGAIDEPAIDSLGVVLRFCQQLRSEDYNDFPDFYWILRDFSLALVGRDNKPLTPNKYLQNSLAAQAGDSENRNRIRNIIRASFVNRTCFTFVRPLTNQQQLQKLDSLDIDQLRPEFTEQVLDFRRMIGANIKTKKIKGKEINADLMCELIRVYLSEINNKKVPQVQTGWKYVCQRQCEAVLEGVERQAEQACSRLMDSLPTTRKQLAEKQEAIMEQLSRLFDSRTLNNDQAQIYRKEIAKVVGRRMEKVQQQMRVRNAQQTKSFIKKQFQNIERRLKSGEFKSMGEMVKQFQLFYEYYRKKCPYKDEIQTGLEFLMKKFSDCSLLIFKNFKAKRDQEILRLKQDVDRQASESAAREEKQKHERTAAADKAAILQSRIQELTRQNRELSQSLARAQGELQRLRMQSEEKSAQLGEEAQYQLITLRKKLLQAEDQFKEVDCKRILQVNNIKNSVVLKENELAHFQEAMAAQASRSNTIIKELQLEREQKEKRIEELSAAVENMKGEAEKVKKVMEEKYRDKSIEISKLEQALQTKCRELQLLAEQKENEMRMLRESFELQKSMINQNWKQQMRSVQEAQQAELQQRAMRLRKSESDMAHREMELKMHRLEVDKEAAILTQKIEFLRQQCSQKEARLAKLQQENSCYVNLFEEKDSQISSLNQLLQEQRAQLDSSVQELTLKLSETTLTLTQRSKQVIRLQETQERLRGELKEKEQQLKYLSERLKTVSKGYEQKLKQVSERLAFEVQSAEKTRQTLEAEIDLLRTENSKSTEEQKRNIELSLVQLKNYYEMERERLEKKNLENRKKHEQSQTNAITQLENKHRKAQRVLQEQIQQLRAAKDALQEQITRMENDFDIKIMAAEEQRENQRRSLVNRYEMLQKKYAELQEQFESYESNSEEERVAFVKRIEGLTFQISRKEKELLQIGAKRQNLQTTLKKRETQFESVKRMMTQQVEGSLKKVSDIQAKYQRLNQEYMQYKIESDKEIALCRQRNEFLTIKLQEATKDRESASSKNIERLDKQKLTDLKEQLDKCKAQVIALQTKNQGLRRTLKEQQAAAMKKIATLQKEKQFLEQKEAISQAKVADLQSKVQQKSELFAKDLDQARGKHAGQRSSLQKECDFLRERLSALQDEKAQASWRLQKDILLLNERIKYLEYQKEQVQRDREEAQKRLQSALDQIKKSNQKLTEDSENKRNNNDKRYVGQIQVLRETIRVKQTQHQETVRKLKQEAKNLRDKNQQLHDKLQTQEKQRSGEKNYLQEIESLKREKENLMLNYRNQRGRDMEEWKKKNTQLNRRIKQLEQKNMEGVLFLQRENSKWGMERQQLLDKIKQLEDSFQWQRNKNQLNKSKSQLKRSESSNIFSSSIASSTGTEFRSFNNWK